jgi:hypothetical protein
MTSPSSKYGPWLVSLLLHFILLLIFSFYTIKPKFVTHWYQIEPYDPLTQWEEPPIIKKESRTVTKEEEGSSLPQTIRTKTALQKSKVSAQILEQENISQPVAGEAAEATELSTKPIPKAIPPVLNNPLDYGLLKGMMGGGSSSGTGTINVSFSKGKGKVGFDFPQDYRHSLGAPGTVTVRFKVDQYGKPIMSTVDAIEQSSPRYFVEARKILEMYRDKFHMIGEPQSGIECELTFIFQ